MRMPRRLGMSAQPTSVMRTATNGEARCRVVLPGLIALAPTMRRSSSLLADPTVFIRGPQVWCATRTEEGTATVRYVQTGDREVEVTAWGVGRHRGIELAPAHLGVDDRPEEFAPTDPRIAALQARFAGLRFGRSGNVLECLVPAILGQKVSGQSATRSWRELVFRYGERAPAAGEASAAPRLWVMPAATTLGGLAYYDFHPLGVERRRAEVIVAAARRAAPLQRAAAAGREALWTQLTAMRGIGLWTAALVASAALGDADAVPLGDYHLPHLVVHALTGAPRGDDARMLELLEPFRPHRGRVVALLAAGAPPPPRFGPRLPVRDIRGL